MRPGRHFEEEMRLVLPEFPIVEIHPGSSDMNQSKVAKASVRTIGQIEAMRVLEGFPADAASGHNAPLPRRGQIMGPTLDGLRGMSVLTVARNSLGTSIAGDRAAAKLAPSVQSSRPRQAASLRIVPVLPGMSGW